MNELYKESILSKIHGYCRLFIIRTPDFIKRLDPFAVENAEKFKKVISSKDMNGYIRSVDRVEVPCKNYIYHKTDGTSEVRKRK